MSVLIYDELELELRKMKRKNTSKLKIVYYNFFH